MKNLFSLRSPLLLCNTIRHILFFAHFSQNQLLSFCAAKKVNDCLFRVIRVFRGLTFSVSSVCSVVTELVAAFTLEKFFNELRSDKPSYRAVSGIKLRP